ncbi:hypothetical protein ACP70R_033437 [Stipagrostis hirtigluma subsp. patula]
MQEGQWAAWHVGEVGFKSSRICHACQWRKSQMVQGPVTMAWISDADIC